MNSDLDPDALRAARQAKGFTQTQLGAAIGVAGGDRISHWELGRAAPHPQQLRYLAQALAVPIAALLRPVSDEQRNLRRLRVEAGLTTAELGQQVHVASPTLKRWESGVVRGLIVRAPVEAMAKALGVTVGDVRAAIRRTSLQ